MREDATNWPDLWLRPAMRPLTLPLAILLASTLTAQPKPRIVVTDTGTVVLHEFTTGQLSTKEWRDQDDHWGRSWAYKKTGEVIFEGQTRRIAGHASVQFSYHPNGAVSKVETSDAPDGGIQWHKSTTTFDEQGNRTGFFEQGQDHYGPIPRVTVQPARLPTEKPNKQETPEEQHMFVNEVFVVNPTNAAVRVVATPKHPSPAMPGGNWTMAPGDTIRIGSYSMGEAWPDWKEQVELVILQVVLGDRQHAVAHTRTDEAKAGQEHRKLFVVIEGWESVTADPGQEHLPGLDKPDPPKKKKRWFFFR